MLVEAELIEQAKERLGDKNFELIMEFLGVEDYDEVRMKCCCPVHDEKTASMVYDRKRYRVHCFGCGATFDFIDAYTKGQGGTFLEAVERLFAEAEVQYVFGERGVKTKREYRYPREESKDNDMEPVLKYLESRGISKEAAEYADIRADERGNIVFNYYDLNDVLSVVKYRPSHKVEKGSGENKMWAQQGADTMPLLFCANKANYAQPLLITEGEMDTLAAFTAGYQNAVSVPFGSMNYTWVEQNWDFLERFNMIIICSDNDEPGVKMRNELMSRLGTWRTKYVEIPQTMINAKTGNEVRVKDLNEVLYFGGKEATMRLIMDAKEAPLTTMTDISDIEEIDLDSIDGVETGLSALDAVIMRLFNGTLTVLSGTPGAGKSSLTTQLMVSAIENGKSCWLYSAELPPFMVKSWFDHILAGRRGVESKVSASGADYYTVKPEYKQEINDYYRGKWFLYDGESNKLDDLLASMENAVRRKGVSLLIADNLMTIDLGSNENNALQKQTEAITKLTAFAVKFNVPIVLVCHPRKLMAGEEIGLNSVSGSQNIVNLTSTFISIKRVTPQEKAGRLNRFGDWETPPCPYDVRLSIIKDRMRGRAGQTIGLFYDIPTRRFFCNEEEFARQYSFDKRHYDVPLEYPVKDMATEAFS